jgi:mono/diheme cytochrome c family protein
MVGLGLVAVVACGAGYFQLTFPKYAPADANLHVSADPELRARGEYLAEHVAVCVDCHSERDFDRYSGPLREGTRGKGGQKFGHEMGLPGELVAPNITPAGIGEWSDGELQRALTSGVTREGRALFPLMNYLAYGQLCERDVHAVMSYVRSFAPIDHQPERSHLDFPVNMLVKTLPKPTAAPKHCPDAKDPVALGEYLVNTAGCRDCHTPRAGGQPIPGKDFAGGSAFPLPSGYVAHSKNITPDAVSGIGGWTQDMFVKRFAAYRDASAMPRVVANGPNTPMPWSMYAGMSDEDLAAIYAYLRTTPAVSTVAAETVATAPTVVPRAPERF